MITQKKKTNPRFFITFLLLAVCVWKFSFSVKAITNTPTPSPTSGQSGGANLVTTCLQAVRCDAATANCSTWGHVDPVFPYIRVHRAKLFIDSSATNKPLPNREGIVMECLEANGEKCVYQKITGQIQEIPEPLPTSYKYQYQGLSGHVNGNTTGEMITSAVTVTSNYKFKVGTKIYDWLEWQSYTMPNVGRNFQIAQTTTGGIQTGASGGQQLGTFSLISGGRDCVAVQWDPYGKVFNADDLTPVENAQVYLYKKNSTGGYSQAVNPTNPFFENPFKTTADGGFSFIVPDGVYKLSLNYNGTDFPPYNSARLSTNCVNGECKIIDQVIYRDLYYEAPEDTVKEEIVQQGDMAHRDIPVHSATMSSAIIRRTNVLGAQADGIKILGYSYVLDKASNRALLKGTLSYPFAKVNAYSKKPGTDGQFARYRLLGSVNADKNNHFSLKINQNDFLANEIFGELELGKVRLTGDFNVNKDKPYQTNIIPFNPIINYLEGQAYDNGGSVLPNAVVKIINEGTKEVTYETTADSMGKYKISSEYIPDKPYIITYTTNGKTIEVSTTEFVARNAEYLKAQKINKDAYKDKNGQIFRPVTGTNNPNQNKENQPTNVSPTGINRPVTVQATSNSVIFIVGAVVLFMIGIVVAVLGFGILKKKQELPPMNI